MMDRNRNHHRRALIITLAVMLLLCAVSQSENAPLSSGVSFITNWMFRLTASATSSVSDKSPEELSAEVEALRKENAELRRKLADYEDIKSENERLWKYYELKKTNPTYRIAPANVIRRDVNDEFYSFTLDVGTSAGVHLNAPVITDNGLVGWVCQADASSCKVKTILSPDTKATVQDKQTGDGGILSGSVSLCSQNLTAMNQLAEDHQLKEGDMVVTAGTGGVYPVGLPVGEVQSVSFDKSDTSRSAVIKPYEDVRTVTAAAVITGFDDSGKVVPADEK